MKINYVLNLSYDPPLPNKCFLKGKIEVLVSYYCSRALFAQTTWQVPVISDQTLITCVLLSSVDKFLLSV